MDHPASIGGHAREAALDLPAPDAGPRRTPLAAEAAGWSWDGLPRLLAELRAADVPKSALLPSLSFFCYAVRAGLDRGSGQDPPVDGSVLGLAAVVEVARAPGPAQEDARWLLDRLGVTPAELGLEASSYAPDALQAAIGRLDAITERLWLLVTTPEPAPPPGVRP